MSFFTELKRRNVIRMAVLYAVGSWLILQIAELLTEILDVPEWTLRFILMILLLGLPLVLIFSWVYEMTPEGLKKESEVPGEHSVTGETARKLDVVVIFLLGAVLLTFAADRLLPREKASLANTSDGVIAPPVNASPINAAALAVETASVAILPFTNLSDDRSNEYFSDGLAETLQHMLARVPEIKVAARTSSFSFKGSNADIPTIAESLNVAHVLEGSVQRAGDRVRINTQLVRAADGYQVWSESYDRTLDDIFAIQDEIAGEVGQALTASLLGGSPLEIEGVSTNDTDAYVLYLEAISQYAVFSFTSLREAEELLQRALAIDPRFTEAMVALAKVFERQRETGDRAPAQAAQLIEALTQRALDIDPENVDAALLRTTTRAWQQFRSGSDPAALSQLVDELGSLVSRAEGEVAPKVAYADLLGSLRRNDEAMAQLERALALDPRNADIYHKIADQQSNDRNFTDFDAIRQNLLRSLELQPDQPSLYAHLGFNDAMQGNLIGLVENYERSIALDPLDPELSGFLAVFLYQLNLPDYAAPYHERSDIASGSAELPLRLELEQAISLGEPQGISTAARAMLDADVRQRNGAFTIAAIWYLAAEQQLGRTNEAVAYMASLYPGFPSISGDGLQPKVTEAAIESSLVLAGDMSETERRTRAREIHEFYQLTGLGEENDEDKLTLLALSGDYQQLASTVADQLNERAVMTGVLDRTEQLLQLPVMAQVRSDPRVTAALAEWRKRLDVMRGELIRYMEQREAQTATAS